MVGADRAIVNEVPGTTRDVIEEQVIIDGIPVRLRDTAGLRSSGSEIEQEGVRRAEASAASADVILYVIDASQSLHDEDRSFLADMVGTRKCLVVLNKIDLGARISAQDFRDMPAVCSSLLSNKDMPDVRSRLVHCLRIDGSGPPHAVISERHRVLLEKARGRVLESIDILGSGREELVVVAASALRAALNEIGRITGRTYDADLLDSVFARFCIGK
jgi:tRNA modification GTPase